MPSALCLLPSYYLCPMPSWYAIYTKPRSEKKTQLLLDRIGIETYLPLVRKLKQWSDRKKWIEEPLIRSYVFVNIELKQYLQVIETPGVVRFVTFSGKAAEIPDSQIKSLKILLANTNELEVLEEHLSPGEKVQIISGSMNGLIGEIITLQGSKRLILRIDHLGYTIKVNIPAGAIKRI
ncbi:MAG: UpxY family transcription antiterminator [Bacteroidetes bacterium]|nr:UpxY family transcription antiterminator [Bacteroidota bacterium]